MTYVFIRLFRDTGVASLFLAACLYCCSAAHAQIAPGPLSKAHADLKGLLNCTSCHGLLGRGLKCLECHDEIKRRVEADTGYHARAYKSSDGDCAQCHEEHRGPGFDFVPLDRKSFKHAEQTGFELEGSHREQQCESCHNKTNIDAAMLPEIKMKEPDRSFLGLRRTCISCHMDPHRKQLGDNCLECHIQQAWRPAPKFNHSDAAFQLNGRHLQVACVECHSSAEAAPAGDRYARSTLINDVVSKGILFKGLSFGECRNCHADPHNGAFQDLKYNDGCSSCHTTGGWRNNNPEKNFDHSLTDFRLVGRHTGLGCDMCHKNGNFRIPVAHDLCSDCHESPHGEEFSSLPGGSDCSICHSTLDFKPLIFTRESHDETAFPLDGKHSTLPCIQCHSPGRRQTISGSDAPPCSECHADPHTGQFTLERFDDNCALCHTTEGFEETIFTPEHHAKTRFPLKGPHAEVACEKCHAFFLETSDLVSDLQGSLPASSVQNPVNTNFAPEEKHRDFYVIHDCDACHRDPHAINPNTDLPCRTCHIPQQPDVPLLFDHHRAGINLSGAHQRVAQSLACIQCHKASGQAEEVATGNVPIFSGTNMQCSKCHSKTDPHGGQFSRPESRGKDCSSCHTPTTWSDIAFDHEGFTFNLNSAHQTASCVDCHKESKEVDGSRGIRMYRGTPVECLGCH